MTILKNSNSRYTALVWLTLIAVTLLGLSMAIISGCTDTLKGDADANRAPIVYFVNIPPDNTEFSFNPEVYWFGSDVDGQIVYYRYLVATIAEADTAANYDEAREWAARQNDQVWTYVDIEARAADPQTSRVIPLSADPDSSITTFVDQFVFLQAFDDDGAGSVIAVKCLSRNDHPPETEIYNSMKDDSPYVNSVTPGGSITGISITWSGTDKADYDERGLVAPPFEYEWKLYGPYFGTEIDSVLDIDSGASDSSGFGFVQYCWFTDEGEQFFSGDSLIIIDSVLVGEGEDRHWDSLVDTVYFEPSVETDNNLGIRRDLLITTTDTAMFINKLVAQSSDGYDSWVTDMQDTLFNVFADAPSTDTTILGHFLFTVRARDDALVPDPTPAFRYFPVINPKYERDILVLDFSSSNTVNYAALRDTVTGGIRQSKVLFKSLLASWNSAIEFDTTTFTGDFLWVTQESQGDFLTLEKALRYKTMIWFSDYTGKQSSLELIADYPDGHAHLLKALESGVNVWATGRALFAGSDEMRTVMASQNLLDYFGIRSMFISGWISFIQSLNDQDPSIRIEDFIGAYSIDESRWPNVDIDPDLLRERYIWPEVGFSVQLPPLPFDPDLAALPEVGWCEREYGTEVMYLYKSLYGREHFLGFPYNIEGAPCGHRLETDLYRTVYLGFPPFAMRQDQMQPLANGILDWLYEPWQDR